MTDVVSIEGPVDLEDGKLVLRIPLLEGGVTAVNLLAGEPELAVKGKRELWKRVLGHTGSNPNKRPNEQMDVVLSLWESGMISMKS